MEQKTEWCAHYAPEEFWKLLQSESNAQPTEAERVINPIAAAMADTDGEVHGLDFTLCDLPAKPANHMPASRALREKVYFPFGKWQSIVTLLKGHAYEAVREPLRNAQGDERHEEAVSVAIRSMAQALHSGLYPRSQKHALLPTGLYDQKTGEALCVVLAKSKSRVGRPYRLDSLATVPFTEVIVADDTFGKSTLPITGVIHISDETLEKIMADADKNVAIQDIKAAVRRAFAMAKMHPEQAKPCWVWEQQQHGWLLYVPEIKRTMVVVFTNVCNQGRSHYSLYKIV